MISKFEEDGLRWFVDDEAGVVICKGINNYDELFREYRNSFSNGVPILHYNIVSKWEKNYGIQMNRIFGKAKANIEAGEVFDLERGKQLAKARFIEKLSAYRASFYNAILDEVKITEEKLIKRIEGNKRITFNSAVKASELSKMSK